MKTLAMMLALPAIALAVPAAAQTMTAADYVKAAGAGDLYERQSSQLVLQTTKDAKIRRFAQMMIQNHTKSTADVTAAAVKSRVAPSKPMLMPAQADMIAQLRAATGTARDTAYIAQQKTAHDEALNLHKTYAASGTAAPLKAAAAKIVPVVQSHIDMLATM